VLGFFGLFGRSREMQRLDQTLREAGLHPRLVPDAIKLTALKLLKEAGLAADREAEAEAARLVAYCMLGAENYAEANGPDPAREAARRLEAALHAGDSLDARLVLLTLHAGVIEAGLVERHGLEAG
jgi:hypothetical protein